MDKKLHLHRQVWFASILPNPSKPFSFTTGALGPRRAQARPMNRKTKISTTSDEDLQRKRGAGGRDARDGAGGRGLYERPYKVWTGTGDGECYLLASLQRVDT